MTFAFQVVVQLTIELDFGANTSYANLQRLSQHTMALSPINCFSPGFEDQNFYSAIQPLKMEQSVESACYEHLQLGQQDLSQIYLNQPIQESPTQVAMGMQQIGHSQIEDTHAHSNGITDVLSNDNLSLDDIADLMRSGGSNLIDSQMDLGQIEQTDTQAGFFHDCGNGYPVNVGQDQYSGQTDIGTEQTPSYSTLDDFLYQNFSPQESSVSNQELPIFSTSFVNQSQYHMSSTVIPDQEPQNQLRCHAITTQPCFGPSRRTNKAPRGSRKRKALDEV